MTGGLRSPATGPAPQTTADLIGAEVAADLITAHATTAQAAPPPVRVAVVSGPEEALSAQAEAFGDGRGFLPVHLAGGCLHIGPLARPGRPPCVACAFDARRLVRAAQGAPAEDDARVLLGEPWLSWARATVAAYLAGDVADELVHTLSFPEGEVREHRIVPRPECPTCADRRTATTRVELRPRVGREPGAEPGRTRTPIPLERLRTSLVDPVYGPVVRVFRDAEAPLAFAGADAAVPGRSQVASGYGRCPDFEAAQQVAILECLERMAGYRPSTQPAAVASAAELGDDAVDLATLGLPDPRWNGHPNSQLRPYHPDTSTHWVRATDLLAGAEVLLPEHVAYWGAHDAPTNARFLYESSNGCALGNCLEEAVFHGALEVVERDAFLLHWYAQLPPAPVDPDSIRDETSRDYLAIIAEEDFEVRVLDITTAVGVPVIWALALDLRDPPEISSLSAAAAHPEPHRAARGALAELGAMCVLRRRAQLPQRAPLLEMLHDPTALKTLEDHVALYTLPESRPRLDWAVDGRRSPVSLDARFPHPPARWYDDDMGVMARRLLEAMSGAGMRSLVVRQTTSREANLGLEAVKVVAPGALAMTFGHVHHRTRGLPRLAAARELTGTRGPVQPHPFP